jgi:hypothetical protein
LLFSPSQDECERKVETEMRKPEKINGCHFWYCTTGFNI